MIQTVRERVEEIIAKSDKFLPRIVGRVTVSEQFRPDRNSDDDEKAIMVDLIIREGYNSDPSTVLVCLPDLLRAATENGANEEYYRRQLGRTGLRPHHARLRFDGLSPDSIMLNQNQQ